MNHLLRSSPVFLTAVLAAVLIGGCSGVPVPPPEVAPIVLTKVNSARVIIWDAWFEKKDNRLSLRGHVLRRYPAAYEDTAKAHLIITFLGAGNEHLLELPAKFTPQKIPRGRRLSGYSIFSVPLDMLPKATTSIQIQAYDDITSTLPVGARRGVPTL